jgi:hypothetical protein
MLLITVLLNYGTLAKLILAKLASKNRMPGFMKLGVNATEVVVPYMPLNVILMNFLWNIIKFGPKVGGP